MKTTIKIIILCVGLILTSCAKTGGMAPSLAEVTAIDISPNGIIVPKSTTFKISILGTFNDGTQSDVTASSRCTLSQPIASIDTFGNLSNTYTGTSIQKLTLTCTNNGQTDTVPVTIVPATLNGLLLTKINLQMAPGQTQPIQVYGNFIDSLNYVFALELTNFVSWSSSSGTVGGAYGGTISALANGATNLTATFSGQSASTALNVSSATVTPTYAPRGVGLLGTYYDFITGAPYSSTIGDPFETLFGERIDSQVYFNWSTGTNNLGQPLYFGIRWTGRIYIPTTGSYTFYTQTDDGVRLWIDDVSGTAVINNWTLHASTENTSAPIVLTGGQFYNIRMDYFENAGYSQAELRWSGPGIAKQLIPQINLFPN